MGRIYKASDCPFEGIAFAAIAIEDGGRHIGLLYREDEKLPIALLHQCWHLKLKRVVPGSNYKIWVDTGLDPQICRLAAAHADLIWSENKISQLPYWASDPRGFFDNDGNIVEGAGKIGLTCSGLVLAIFDLSGAALIIYDTWEPREDDPARQQEWIDEMKKRGVGQAHIEKCSANFSKITYRPLEVAGAAASNAIPANFRTSVSLGEEIKKLLPARPG